MDDDERQRGGDPDRFSPLGRKALVLVAVGVAVGVVVLLLELPGWIVVAALVLFLIWLLIEG